MTCKHCEALEIEINRLKEQISRMHKEHNEEIREMNRDARDAVAEARWQARQGEDYGSW